MKKEVNPYQIHKQVNLKNELSPSDSIKQSFLNMKGCKESPIKIISSKLLKNQYSDHKDIELTYKNVSKKKSELSDLSGIAKMLLTNPQAENSFL